MFTNTSIIFGVFYKVLELVNVSSKFLLFLLFFISFFKKKSKQSTYVLVIYCVS